MRRQTVLTAEEIEQLDRFAIETVGIPSIILMENAGRAVFECIKKDFKTKPFVSVVCGTGNNGGDGFVIARYLLEGGIPVKVFLTGNSKQLKPDAAINYKILVNFGITIEQEFSVFARNLSASRVIVDAVFGFGLNRDVSGLEKSVIGTINASGKKVYAVDIPSGLNATTGKIQGVCVKAFKTITFSFPKKGLFINDGPRMSGKIIVAPIGISSKVLKLWLNGQNKRRYKERC